MRAAVFGGVGVLSITDRPPPRLATDDDVLIRVLACGLCGTDVHILSDPPGHPARTGVVLGHEFVGDVAAVGPAVGSVAMGDRIAVRPILTCGKCRYCRTGAANHCARMDAIGVYRDGGLADYVLAPESACFAVDRSIPVHVAALTEPLACVVNAAARARLVPGDDVVIIGAGAIGLLFLTVLRAAGAGRIVVVEPAAARREVARQMGASAVVDPAASDIPAVVSGLLPDGPNIVIDAVGSQLATAVRIAGRRARIMLFGMNTHAEPAVPQCEITTKELEIVGSYVGQHSFPDAIRLLESGTLDLAPIVSDVGPLDRLTELVDALRGGRIVKAVITL